MLNPNSTIVEPTESTKVFNRSCILLRMEKFSAQESYRRMAEFVVESGVTDEAKITSTIAKAAKVSFEAASKWKDGRTKSITTPPISRFCDKYGASPDYVATGQLPKTRGENDSEELQELVQRFLEADQEGRQYLLQTSRLVGKKDTSR